MRRDLLLLLRDMIDAPQQAQRFIALEADQ